MAYGMAGVLSGIAFAEGRLPRKNWVMGVFCFVCTVTLIGPLLDTSTVTIVATKFTWENMLPIYASGLPVNLTQGACSFLTMMLFGNAILEKLERVKTQYGMMETQDDGLVFPGDQRESIAVAGIAELRFRDLSFFHQLTSK